jgi:general secretion pathway protein G
MVARLRSVQQWMAKSVSGRTKLEEVLLNPASRVLAAEGIRVPGSGPFRPQSPRLTVHRNGFTLVELIVAMTILMILTAAATPVVRITIQRNKERELRRDLWELRDSIDRYKDAADRGAFQTKLDSQGYPPDLDTLVKGVDSNGKKIRFLRRIPVDPMTGKDEWGLRSMQDDPDSDSWGGQSVFDVYTKSDGTALDGTKYKTW